MALLEIAEACSASRLVGGRRLSTCVTDGQRQYQELNFARYLIVVIGGNSPKSVARCQPPRARSSIG
jgi:hypothetical protein